MRREQERQAQLSTGQQPRKRLRRRKRTHTAGEKAPSIKKAAGSKLPQNEGNRSCHPDGHYQDYYPGALSLYEVNETLFEVWVQVDVIY